MSRIITFSKYFPAYHPRKGEPTYFVEQIYNSIYRDETGDWSDALGTTSNYVVELNHNIFTKKHHTIRAGSRWKVGDKFSPVWSGKPYQSKQIILAPDITILSVQVVEMDLNGIFSVDGKYLNENDFLGLAKNDGLNPIDMLNWFMPNFDKPKQFNGQLLVEQRDKILNYA